MELDINHNGTWYTVEIIDWDYVESEETVEGRGYFDDINWVLINEDGQEQSYDNLKPEVLNALENEIQRHILGIV